MAGNAALLNPGKADPAMASIIKLAIMAVGGQGGSVLTNWIEDTARANGHAVQATSVAGVAQRTGATIYYIEMAPKGERDPIFSLMPAAGDVDTLVAAEMMEAGRAILRGFVTPDRTTLIASSHRALAVSEKTAPGDGIANAEEVMAAAGVAARRFICFDMEKIAVDAGTVISASLFGALAGSGTLPFTRAQFEAAIRASGRGVEASLKAFAIAYEQAAGGTVAGPVSAAAHVAPSQFVPAALATEWESLQARLALLPEPARAMAGTGLKSVVDFQDAAYGAEYLSRLEEIAGRDDASRGHLLTVECAKYLARAMVYDDVIRVADLKTRSTRMARVGREMAPPPDALMHVTEFMHPRAEELIGLLPAGFGRRVSQNAAAMRFVDKLFNRGRRLRSDRLLPFLQLYALAGLRRWRRGTLRHAKEQAHMQTWLDGALRFISADYDLAVEMIRNRRLIKGYSDTHARGISKFDRVNDGAALVAGRVDAADWVRRLRDAALKDEKGVALEGALQTVRSFAAE
ncbi:MAG TPA: indolepyruvate oxidoreductase subunit beta family protein, partial [Rhizobiaceae bacterium]|nr:indolepyruvate oxidoreductase subunit beta family protein [Rhizobiaceae bacterium]